MAFGKRNRDPYAGEDDWDGEYGQEDTPHTDVRRLFDRLRRAEPEEYSDAYGDEGASEEEYDEYDEEAYDEEAYDEYADEEYEPFDEEEGYEEYVSDDEYASEGEDEEISDEMEVPARTNFREAYAVSGARPSAKRREDSFWDEPAAEQPRARRVSETTAEEAEKRVPPVKKPNYTWGEEAEEEPKPRVYARRKNAEPLPEEGAEEKGRRFAFLDRFRREKEDSGISPAELSRRSGKAETAPRERETYERYGMVPEEKLSVTNKALVALVALLSAVALVMVALSAMNLLGKNVPLFEREKKTVAPPAPTEGSTGALSVLTDPVAVEPTEAPIEPEATPEPVGTKAELTAEGILVPGERGPVVPERAVKLKTDDFYKSTFIGNSFVTGMKLWSDIDKCEYVCNDGVSLDNMIGNYLYYVTVRNYDSIYLTLGLNEIGWPVDSFIAKYEKVIDYIRSDALSKTATIYITSIMPTESIMETTPGESGNVIHLDTIRNFNEKLKDMCQRKGCWFIDVYSALADETGYLPAEIAADDHVHFEPAGYKIWTEYLLNHYVDESLLEE